jgi:hypothetical protein
MTTILIVVALILLTLYGTPLFAIISTIAMLAFYFADIDTSVVIVELYRLASQPVLLAIPLFTFAGYLLAKSDAPRRLINFSRYLRHLHCPDRRVRGDHYRPGGAALSYPYQRAIPGKFFVGFTDLFRQPGDAFPSQSSYYRLRLNQ